MDTGGAHCCLGHGSWAGKPVATIRLSASMDTKVDKVFWWVWVPHGLVDW